MRIAFFASSQLALPTLHQLLTYQVVCGICVPAKEYEGKQHFRDLAKMANMELLEIKPNETNSKLKRWIQKLKPDYGFVLTFSYKLPEVILNSAAGGFYNIHFGALPQYRGPEPLFWQMKNQEEAVDITIHQMDADWDTGAIVMVDKVPINNTDIYGGMQVKLSQMAVMTVMNFINALGQGMIVPRAQEGKGNYYKKPLYHDVLIDWEQQDAQSVEALVRATNPWNKGAISHIRGITVKIIAVREVEMTPSENSAPGTLIYPDSESGACVVTTDQKVLSLDIFYLEEGFMTGIQFKQMGIPAGERFTKG
ncbi:hypothetical protein KFE94_15500 [bacterium SCSIO 12643]|nr:hypothetical protein KFE94_15500 [bacterium SCSIO 12643]